MSKVSFLMTGASTSGGPGIIRCLQADTRIELVVCDASENASGRFLNDRFFICPRASDPGFIDFYAGKVQCTWD